FRATRRSTEPSHERRSPACGGVATAEEPPELVAEQQGSKGEPNESCGSFSLSTFWDTLSEAVKATSQEATKLSLMFSKPPVPTGKECMELCESMQKSILSLSTVFFWLPQSQGVRLRLRIRDATVDLLEGLDQLLEAVLSSHGLSLSQEQLLSTGGVWAACDQFSQLPRENRSAVQNELTMQQRLVKDALEELQQALAEAPPVDEEDEEHWSQSERELVCETQGLIKASAAALRKLSSSVRSNGRLETQKEIQELDGLADAAKHISPGVDDLALSLYPPVERQLVQENVFRLAAMLRKLLELTRSSHVCEESDVAWVDFLDGAVEHNLEKIRAVLQT
ncbi:hypothetical protein DNTS_003500, partial [Danionella cerebrum]